MANTFVASRAHLIWAICLPLAILVGYLLAEPLDSGSLAVLVLLAAVLSVPLLLNWHHTLLVVTWNAAILPSFFPGAMSLWMAIAVVSFTFGVLNRATSPANKFHSPLSVSASLGCLLLVALMTMLMTGGMGVRVLNHAKFGGKAYFYILFAVIGFFGLVSRRIPKQRAVLFAGVFFFSGITEAASNLIYMIGPKAYPLFHIFPVGMAYSQAVNTENLASSENIRIGGFGLAAVGVVAALLAVYGIKGLLDFKKPWRIALLLAALVAEMYSGFRSMLILCLLSMVVVFFLEGLHRTRTLFVCLGLVVMCGTVVLLSAPHMPLQVQRALSFLPIEVDPMVRQDAQMSVDWRVSMWKEVLPEVPPHLLVGKGYVIDPSDLELTNKSVDRGLTSRWGAAALVGDYHNGPLSLVIPLGGFGVLAFLWFLGAGGRALYLNYRYGDPDLATVNRFLLAYFLVRILYFVLVFGSFYLDLFVFTGIVGLGLSLNGGVRRAEVAEPVYDEELAWSRF